MSERSPIESYYGSNSLPADEPQTREFEGESAAPATPAAPARPARSAIAEYYGTEDAPPPPGERSLLGDVGRTVASSAVGTAATAVGGLEYAAGSGGTLTRWREQLTGLSESLMRGVSPQMQAALNREFVPGSSGDPNAQSAYATLGDFVGSVAAHAVSLTGSLVSAAPAVIAAGMATPAMAIPVATIVMAGTGATLGAGTVWNEVAQEFGQLPEESRMRNPTYARLRGEGADEASAINETLREVAGAAVQRGAAGSAIINSALGPFLGRLGAGTLGGVMRGAAHGGVSEFATEAADEAFTTDQTQRAQRDLTGRPLNYLQTAEAGVRAGVGAGVSGAGLGGLGGLRDRTPPAIDPGIVQATEPYVHPAPGGTTPPAGTSPVAPAGTPPGAPPIDPSIAQAAGDTGQPGAGAPPTPEAGPQGAAGLSVGEVAQGAGQQPAGTVQGAAQAPPTDLSAPQPGEVDPNAPQGAQPGATTAVAGVEGAPPQGEAAPPAAAPVKLSKSDLNKAGAAAADQNGLASKVNPIARASFLAGFATGAAGRPAVDQADPAWTQGYASAQAILNGTAMPAPMQRPAAPPVTAPTSVPTDTAQKTATAEAAAAPVPTEPALTPPATPSPNPLAAETGVADTGNSPAAPSVASAPGDSSSGVPSPPPAQTPEAVPEVKDAAREQAVAEATPAPAKPKRAKVVTDAAKAAKGELVARTKAKAARVLSEVPGDADVQALVDSILNDAANEIGNTDGKSYSNVLTLLLDESTKRIDASLAATAKAQAEAETKAKNDAERAKADREEKARERTSKNLVVQALDGAPGAMDKLFALVIDRPQDKLGSYFREHIAPHLAGRENLPPWLADLKTIVESGGQGGSAEMRAARTEAVKSWRTRFAATKDAAVADAAKDGRDKVWNVFANNAPEPKETLAESAKRYQRIGVQIRAALGNTLAAQESKVGKDENSLAMLEFADAAASLRGGSNSVTPAGNSMSQTDEVIMSYRAVEALIRAGDPQTALAFLADARAEGASLGSKGLDGASDSNVDEESVGRAVEGSTTNDGIDNTDESTGQDEVQVALDEQKLLALVEQRLLAAGDRMLRDAAKTVDTSAAEGATDAELAAYRARRATRAPVVAASTMPAADADAVKAARAEALKASLANIMRAKTGVSLMTGQGGNMISVRESARDIFLATPTAVFYADAEALTETMFPTGMSGERMPTLVNGRTRTELAGVMQGEVALGTGLDKDLWKFLSQKVGNIPVLVYPDALFAEVMGERTAGAFIPNSLEAIRDKGQLPGVIVVPQSLVTKPNMPYNGVSDLRETLMHEMIHGGTLATVGIANTRARNQLESLMVLTRNALKKKGISVAAIEALEYGLQGGPMEFIAVALTNYDAQQALMGIPVSASAAAQMKLSTRISNAFQAFVEWIGQTLGFPRTTFSVLEHVVEIAERAIQNPDTQRAQLLQSLDLRLADEAESTMKLSRVFSGITNVLTGATPLNETKLAGIVQGAKRMGLGFSTMRQMEIMGDSLYKRDARMDMLYPGSTASPMRQASTAHNRRAQNAQDMLTKFLVPVRSLDALSKSEQESLNRLMVDATVAEAHPDEDINGTGKNKHLVGKKARQIQGRARHVDLRKRYLALSPREKAAYHEVVNSFRNAHSAVVKALVNDGVDRWWIQQVDRNLADPTKNPLPIQYADLAGLKARAFAGTLTPADEAMLGDQFWEYLQNARNRNKMDGPYVPLQRFGDYVVRWQENAPEFVTFPDQAAADTHIAASPYAALSQKVQHFDAAGNVITAADPAIEANAIGVAVSALPAGHSPGDRLTAVRKAKADALKQTITRDSKRSEVVVQQQVQGLAFFESLAEANAHEREMREAGKLNVAQVSLRADPRARQALIKDADFEKMKSSIERDPTLPAAFKNKAIDSLSAAMLLITPNRTLSASLIKRRKVIGASQDIKRVLANYGIAVSNFAAGVESNLPIVASLKAMNDQTRDGARTVGQAPGTTLSRGNFLREVETRLLEAPSDSGGRGSTIPIVRKVQSLAYIYYLASPSYSMIQMTQPWLLSAPVLGARFGMGRGVRALSKAMSDIGIGKVLGGGVKDTLAAMRTLATGKESAPQPLLDMVKAKLARQPDGADLNRMLDELAAEGLVDGSAGLELIRAELAEEGRLSKKMGQTEALARAFPAAIEVVNRTSTAVAAYRLARQKGATHEKAVLAAREITDQTQADYSSSNTARYMDPRRYPWIAPLMTFRKYAQAIYSLLVRQAYLMVKGETKEVRRQAFRTLAYTLLAHMAVAGTLGLPTEVFNIVLGAAALLFGEGEPWDWEKEIRQMLAEAFGPEAAEVIARGLPRLAGVDLHSRLGLNSLIFINDLRDFENRSMLEYLGQFLGGAPGTMLANMLAAPKQIAEGHADRAVEGVLPKGFRDVLRASRIANEGVTTRRGERIDGGRDSTGWEMAVQALGFTPAAQAEAYERRNAVQSENRRITQERTTLMRQWRQADPADRGDVWDRIVEWNQELPPEGRGTRITRANLVASLREATRRSRASGQEDYLPRNREYLRREGEFANTRD